MGGAARIEGRRIAVYHIQSLHDSGLSAEQIADEFRIEVSEVEEALAYAKENPREMLVEDIAGKAARLEHWAHGQRLSDLWDGEVCPRCGEGRLSIPDDETPRRVETILYCEVCDATVFLQKEGEPIVSERRSSPDSQTWTETMTEQERVRAVVETLAEPVSVEEIGHRADVSKDSSERELERLVAEDRVEVVTREVTDLYRPNRVRLLFDEILQLIDGHTREELEQELESLVAERGSLQNEFDVTTPDEFRRSISKRDTSADEKRELRNMLSTWKAIEGDIWLFGHALRLYDDVTHLGAGDPPDRDD